MLDAMQQLMTGDAEFFDQAFLEELRACWDETHPDLASAQDNAWQVTRYTGRMGWMANRKWKEVKQQPSMLPSPAVPGCCLVSFHFLCDIHSVAGRRSAPPPLFPCES